LGADNKKIITMSFVAAAVIAAFVTSLLMDVAASAFGAVARLQGSDVFRHGLPVAVLVLVFGLLQFRPKMNVWADEVVSEIRKVVWPSRKDTMGMTMVVCILVVMSGVVVFGFDWVAAFIVEKIVQ
jgi:preprotein translocase subunit SecE